jgi:hypothetical protein
VARREDLGRLVARAVVDDDHLEALARERLGVERGEQRAQPRRAVPRRHHHGDVH